MALKARFLAGAFLLAAGMALLVSCTPRPLVIRDAKTLQRVETEIERRRSNALLLREGKKATFKKDWKLANYSNQELADAMVTFELRRIYLPDDRVDVPLKIRAQLGQATPMLGNQVIGPELARNLDGVALLVDTATIPCTAASCDLTTQSFESAQHLCPNMTFGTQPVAADACSAFLVAPDVVMTAAHCIREANYTDKRFVFGFRGGNGVFETHFATTDVYSASEIISRKEGTPEYAVVRLDRKVCGREPLQLDLTTKLAGGDQVYVIGHPAGLPLKFAPNAVVGDSSDDLFIATLDILGGNSGSPVFLQSSHKVVGILTDGSSGYVDLGVDQGHCRNIAECPAVRNTAVIGYCEGEGSTPITAVPPFSSAATCP